MFEKSPFALVSARQVEKTPSSENGYPLDWDTRELDDTCDD